MVVPKRSPYGSRSRAALLPLLPSREASVVMFPLPTTTSKYRPGIIGTALGGGAEEIAGGVNRQTGLGFGPIATAVEGGKCGDRSAARYNLKHRSFVIYTAVESCPIRSPLLSTTNVPWGAEPLLKVAIVVIVPLPATTSNTEAGDPRKELESVPKRLPWMSSTRPAKGSPGNPKEARVVMELLPARTSNTVPWLAVPPLVVEPKRFPLLSRTSAPWGMAPSLPLNEAMVVMVVLPAATSNTVPWFVAPPLSVVPKRLPFMSITKPDAG